MDVHSMDNEAFYSQATVSRPCKSEMELKAIAELISKVVVIRTYENGNSKDTKRAASEVERDLIFKVVYAALLSLPTSVTGSGAYFRGCDNGALSTAEFMLQLLMKDVNAYDTVYIPLREVIAAWDINFLGVEPSWFYPYMNPNC